jgi:hypothetical protein
VLGACWKGILDAILRNILRVEEMHGKSTFRIGVCSKSAFGGA